MAKLALLVATFALAFFLVNASIYRTSITPDGDEQNWSQGGWQSCQDQIWRQGYLPNCQGFVIEEAFNRPQQHSSRYLNSCCYELQNLREDCRCEGLKHALGQQLRLQGVRWETPEAAYMCEAAETALNRKLHYLERCQWYMQQETGGSSTYNTQLLNSCCDQLQNLDEGCRCTGLKQAVREQLQEGQWESEEAKDMFEVAERALRKCDLEPRRCDMQSQRWF
ncbi:2S sulfur-rich seed storage protein 2-like [Gossypium australe]|uniref:2S sulfur-rich seed storage protein 2-like n=1 Tax=Gossypium australe TaxID=47621 RepID=A0A5B6U854_9ROSI|nr:2S sulfur-rich seed storage protein 2-like [Gossypium australe]